MRVVWKRAQKWVLRMHENEDRAQTAVNVHSYSCNFNELTDFSNLALSHLIFTTSAISLKYFVFLFLKKC